MDSFIAAAFGYPTAIYTALLGFALFYWILALLGFVDFESSGLDIDLDIQTDAAESLSGLAGMIVAFGLNGVPFSVAFSLLALIGWTLCCSASLLLLPLLPTSILPLLAGTLILLLSCALSLPITVRLIRPMRGLFVSHTAISNETLVGQLCKVLTQQVDQSVGRAEVAQRGASVNIRVWADAPNTLSRNAVARIVAYDAALARYQIVAESAP